MPSLTYDVFKKNVRMFTVTLNLSLKGALIQRTFLT